ncbi:MAG TPA: hypothetical protein VKD08_07420 [Ignavibacteriaceae bacterium]|nr:hypothetical protein [Ignavibacteriaceae bacterium]
MKERLAPTISDKERAAKPKPGTVNFFIHTAGSFFEQEMMTGMRFVHIQSSKIFNKSFLQSQSLYCSG